MLMQYPLARFPAQLRGHLLTLFLIGTLALWAVSFIAGNHLATAEAPAGIISLEMAGTADRVDAILESWGARERLLAAFSLGLDYLFLVTYSTFFGLACISAGEAARTAGSRLAALADLLAWGQWLAATLDATENVALLYELLGSLWPAWPLIAFYCSSFKFALIGAGLIYVIWGIGLRTMEDFLNHSA